MSLQSRKAIALASVLAIAASGAAATSAQANFQKTLTYTCIYPYVGAQPLSVAIDAAIPATFPIKTLTPKLAINAVATAGGNTSGAVATVGATSIEGVTKAKSTITATGQAPLPITVPITVPNQAVKSTGNLVLNAAGTTPAIQFQNAGPATITVDSIALNLIARTASGAAVQFDSTSTTVPQTDDNPETFDVSCTMSPSNQNTVLANIMITDPANGGSDTTAPSAPGKPSSSGVTATTANLSWSASSDDSGVSSYEVTYNGKTISSPTNSALLTGLTAKTSYTVTVKAKDASGNTSGASSSTSFTTAAADAGTGTTVIDYGYNLTGSASLKSLVTGSLPLTGSIAAKLELPSNKFTGELTLGQSKGKLTALGFLPVDAVVNLVPTEKVTGTLIDGKLKATAKVRIKLPSVKTFGIELAGGANCQAKNISSIALNSTQTFFYPLQGGPLAGTFAISDLTDCGFLTGIVSPLTAGSGNTIAMNLVKK